MLRSLWEHHFMVLLLGVVSTVIWLSHANAAVINATSCSRTHVNAAISSAVSGDTIMVPSGTATWSSGISIPANKDLSIIGAGIGNTNITCSGGSCFIIAQSGRSSASRISGFTFINGDIDMRGLEGGKPVRIDHNRFTSSSGLISWNIAGWTDGLHPSVLIDNNRFHNHRLTVDGTIAELTDGSWQHQIWAQEPPRGAYGGIVYIESNEITTSGITANMPDAARGGRFVFRFNRMDRDYTEFHGVQGDVRAGQWWEIYNNKYTNNPWTMMFIRGGSGFCFNNTSDADDSILINTERSCASVSVSGRCNGSSPWDGNTPGQYGYPCRDQIGRIKDNSLWTSSNPFPSQAFHPAYFFNNRYGARELSVSIHQDPYCSQAATYHMLEDRDYFTYSASFNGTRGVGIGTLANRPSGCTAGVAYWATDQGNWNKSGSGGQGILYRCTSTNKWELYYTPYTYPHPLTLDGSENPSAPLAPGSLRVIK